MRNYRFQSVLFKNFILVFALVFVPLAGMGAFIYQSSNRMAEGEINQNNRNVMHTARDAFETICREMNLLATQISLQDDTQQFYLESDEEEILRGKYKSINTTIDMFTLIYPYIDSIYVFSEKSNYVISNKENSYLNHFLDQTWMPYYEQSEDGHSKTLPRKSMEIYPYLLSFVKPSYINSAIKTGAVVVNIDLEETGKKIQGNSGQQDQAFYVVNDRNQFIYSEDPNLLFDDTNIKEVLGEAADPQFDSGIVKVGGDKYMASTAGLPFNGWRFVSMYPMNMYEAQSKDMFQSYLLGLIGIVITIAIVIALLISIRMFQPIRSLISVVDDPDVLEREGLSKFFKQSNEVHYISRNIMKTVVDNKRLAKELKDRLTLLNEAQALALQAQINPHFLSNTLEMINWMAVDLTEGENKVSTAIGTLSNLLSLSLDMENRMVPIHMELEHAKLYLQIVEIRQSREVLVQWDVDPAILDHQIVKLSIQPLIENAVSHGINASPEHRQGVLTVRGRALEDTLVIQVQDNGAGMGDKRVQELNRLFEEKAITEAQHIGLRNVNQRIKLSFGDKYGLHVDSRMGEGTTVTLTIPKWMS